MCNTEFVLNVFIYGIFIALVKCEWCWYKIGQELDNTLYFLSALYRLTMQTEWKLSAIEYECSSKIFLKVSK